MIDSSISYHFDGTRRNFFEGWYFKVSIPEQRQSFCFMYSVENPAFHKPLNSLEQIQYGPRSTGVGAQILGADDKYICQYTQESHNFWGSKFLVLLFHKYLHSLDGWYSLSYRLFINTNENLVHLLWVRSCIQSLSWLCESSGRHELMLGNSFSTQKGKRPPTNEVPPQVDILLEMFCFP